MAQVENNVVHSSQQIGMHWKQPPVHMSTRESHFEMGSSKHYRKQNHNLIHQNSRHRRRPRNLQPMKEKRKKKKHDSRDLSWRFCSDKATWYGPKRQKVQQTSASWRKKNSTYREGGCRRHLRKLVWRFAESIGRADLNVEQSRRTRSWLRSPLLRQNGETGDIKWFDRKKGNRKRTNGSTGVGLIL